MLKRIVIFLIKAYQILLSSWLPKRCRFEPSCSNYAIIAIAKYGIITGSILTLKRLLRCHPFGGSGYDPVK